MEKYSEDKKLAAVEAYCSGQGGLRAIAVLHEVDVSSLRQWVGAFKALGISGLRPKRRELYGIEFKLAVLQRVRDEGLSHRQAAALFDIRRFDIITAWERAFKKDGMAGLVQYQTARRSAMRHAEPSSPPHDDGSRTRQELLDELAALRSENAYLKKVDALVQAQAKSAQSKERKS